jgi:hypothetical protein
MNVITMYREGETAQVDSTHKKTYQNFLAHGWVETMPAETPTFEPAESKTDEPPASEKVPAAPKSRKAR